jgi:energy-coupling factor transporter ATP-binding protein EcfA2
MSVVWLTGPTGAGKSTLGRALRALVNPVASVALLDEDDVVDSAGMPSRGANTDGRAGAAQLSRSAGLLARKGGVVVVSSADDDPAVLAWNRVNLPGYREVRLEASPETIRHRELRRSRPPGTAAEPLAPPAAKAESPSASGEVGAPVTKPSSKADLVISMDEPEPPELLAFRVAVLIPEFVVAAAGAAGMARHWQGHGR